MMEREALQNEPIADGDPTLAVAQAFFASLFPMAKPPKMEVRAKQRQESLPKVTAPRIILTEPGINTLPVQPS